MYLFAFEQLQLHVTNSDKFSFHLYSDTNIFLVMASLDTAIILKWTFNSKYHELFKVSLILISHFDINFSFECFLLCNHPLRFFSLLTLLRLSMALSKISLGKCPIALENTWVIFKYLLILISNRIPQ